jgi:quinol monooxygenase YgiN
MYEVLVTATVKLERRNDFEALIRRLRATTLKNDAGCELYDWYRTESGESYFLFERWTDEDAIIAHSRAEHFLQVQPQLRACIENEFQVTKLVRVA